MPESVRYPRAGCGIMVLREGKVLLGLRNDDPEKADSALHGEGTWTFPGGKMDFHDTVFGAAKRELKEETDLTAGKMEIFSITNERVHDNHFVTLGFLCRDFEGDVKAMEPDEMVKWRWFGFDELPENMFSPTRKMIKNYLDGELYKH
jgi:8-oxo-dGTP pyrophosphatase MutT (NUDIX family)